MLRKFRRCGVGAGDDANAASVPTLTSGAGAGDGTTGTALAGAATRLGVLAAAFVGVLAGLLAGVFADVVAFAARVPRAVVRRVGSVTVHPSL
ncbi:hypothetical protein A5630_08285 [Mycolicibacterium mucogenicum]|uniref:Uncharacterized protein n=1 Tax=Mycolicibacterium mucogenicum TaxID=56689 RepID=A0A1A3GL20_MYCMU|nr:hypothetical protein A5630_08285 [Mycolicibacterium mucogenicum]